MRQIGYVPVPPEKYDSILRATDGKAAPGKSLRTAIILLEPNAQRIAALDNRGSSPDRTFFAMTDRGNKWLFSEDGRLAFIVDSIQ